MNYLFKNFILVLVIILFPFLLSAAEIRVTTPKSDIKTNEQFVVSVTISSDDSLNAVEGQLVYPSETLEVKEIRDGNSVINFWVEKPNSDTAGAILFSGITPGGFNGDNNFLFSVVFQAQQTGSATVALQEVQALLNDGLGTKADLTIENTTYNISEGDDTLHEETFTDTEKPEDFTPIVTKDESLFEGNYFLVFSTQDKGIGIDHYEIREGFFGDYITGESPYVLKDQSLNKKIYVKAIDKAGNEKVAILSAQHPLPWYQRIEILGILFLLVIVAIVALQKIWPKFTR